MDAAGAILLDQQRLLALHVDTARDGIVAELRPLLAPAASVDAHRETVRQQSLQFDPQGTAECDWVWRRQGVGLTAMLVAHGRELPCTAPSMQSGATAGGQWILAAEEVWIRDALKPARGARIRDADPARSTYQRLFRTRTFGCSWLAASAAPAPATALFEVHDRGGEYRLESATGGGLILRLMRGPLPTERLRGQREVTSLAVISSSSGRIHAESRASGAADYVTLSFADQFIECALR